MPHHQRPRHDTAESLTLSHLDPPAKRASVRPDWEICSRLNEKGVPDVGPRHSRPVPRLIRFRDAPHYLGMDRNRFNVEVRPFVTEVKIGKQGVAFDRLELDAWVEDYLARNGRPGRSKGVTSWDANETQASRGGRDVGSSTSASAGSVFAKALEQLSLRKLNGTSHE